MWRQGAAEVVEVVEVGGGIGCVVEVAVVGT
jgi:hypothetical protein